MNLMPDSPQMQGAPGPDLRTWDTTKAQCPVILSEAERSRRTCISDLPGAPSMARTCAMDGIPRPSTRRLLGSAILTALLLFAFTFASAQKPAWRQASDAELASLLPARAPVEREHIETEMRTASGIVNARGRYIAGVVLLTAGYSADGKYSHYLVVQTPIRIGGIALKPGEYVFGWSRSQSGEALSVHFHEAATGALVGTTDAHRLTGSSRVESLHIWPPSDKALIQIGRFGIPYELGEE